MTRLETTKSYFDRIAVLFNSKYAADGAFQERKRIWERLIEENLAPLYGGAPCIDIGCGDGTLSRVVAAHGITTIGLDHSDAMLTLARHRSEEHNLTAHTEYIHAQLPLRAELMDRFSDTAGLILCSSVLEYIDAYESVLKQIYELLCKNGRLIVSVPNGYSLYRLGEKLFGRMLAHRGSYLRHQRHNFYPDRFQTLMTTLGFTPIYEEYFSLPLQRYTARLFRRYRGKHIATLYLIVAEKS